MRERDLSQRWFERLDDALSLPTDERLSAVEEIEAHVELAADELAARGVPRDVAVRRTLEQLGAPERLARDITAAHRRPLDILTAAGVAFRVTLATGFTAFVLAWAGLVLLIMLSGLAVQGVRRLVDSQFLQVDWSPMLDGLIPAAIGALVALAVGRALVPPVATAAHRSRSQVRWPILILGVAAAAGVAMTAIEARWSATTALAMMSLPAWYALGVLRPDLGPRWQLPRRWFIGLVVLMLTLPIVGLAFGRVTVTTGGSIQSEPFDPNVAYSAVGRFVDLEEPPLRVVEDPDGTAPWTGPGPIRIERTGTFVTNARAWTDVRLEVWQGPMDDVDGPGLDPSATAPLVTAPMTIDGRRVHGAVDLGPAPGRSFYYVAVTGLTHDGERVQLAWPGIEHWQWRGTVLQFAEAIAR